ncbi:MAG: hypothetical protein GEV09_12730 [Pseudonocardiaceae bacterium]|nr:hypothetical protein [Pseudonocardiaceae bacterium]
MKPRHEARVPEWRRRLLTRPAALGVVLVALAIIATALLQGVRSSGEPGDDPMGPAGGEPAPAALRGGSAFSTVEPGTQLPSGAECAQRIERDPWEPRPRNAAANHSVPQDHAVPAWTENGYAPEMNSRIIPRIDGQFTGTTNEIIAWGACKWGFDADMVRAMAVEESNWRQSETGDVTDDPAKCVGGDTAPCPTSFGLLQVKHTFRPGSYPYAQRHTAFNVDYALGAIRGCYEGWVTYLDSDYGPGDLWGCVGWHFSGEWKDPQAFDYIERVQEELDAKPWLRWRG